jgi:hypothetical protein
VHLCTCSSSSSSNSSSRELQEEDASVTPAAAASPPLALPPAPVCEHVEKPYACTQAAASQHQPSTNLHSALNSAVCTRAWQHVQTGSVRKALKLDPDVATLSLRIEERLQALTHDAVVRLRWQAPAGQNACDSAHSRPQHAKRTTACCNPMTCRTT